MKVAKNRNYWLAWFGCISCTALTLGTGCNLEILNKLFMSDVNVSVWLFVAWMFDDK